MNVTTRRAVSIVAAVVLVAAVAATTAPDAVGAPKSATDFTIKTSLHGSWGFSGKFQAHGAISDSGDAYDYEGELDLRGKHGSMLIWIFITHREGNMGYGTFWIIEADGAYAGLVDVVGTYTEKLTTHKPKWGYPEEHPKWRLSQTLEGSLPEE